MDGTFKRYRGRLLTAAGSIAGGAILTGAAVVVAGGDEEAKRPVQQVEAPTTQPPPGTPIAPGGADVRHGRFLLFAVGNDPTPVIPSVRAASWEQRKANSAEELTPALFPILPRLPDGYEFAGGGYVLGSFPDGSQRLTEGSARFDNRVNFPITVGRWTPVGFDEGHPYPVVVRQGGLAVSAGEVGGRPAVFVHRREGAEGNLVQKVFVEDGNYIIAVESYLDDLNVLLAVAESMIGANP